MNHTSARALERRFKMNTLIISSLLFLAFALLSYIWNSNVLRATLIAMVGTAFILLLLWRPMQIVLWVPIFWFLMMLIIYWGPSFPPMDEIVFAASIALAQGATTWVMTKRILDKSRAPLAFLEIVVFVLFMGLFLIVRYVALGY